MRAKLSAKSKLAGGKAEELSRKLAAATAAKGPTQRAAGQVTNREWKELIKLSGGPGRLLDALEGWRRRSLRRRWGSSRRARRSDWRRDE